MSPFLHFLHDLRLQHQIRQSELAELLGYEQSYISALEVGIKGPSTNEFIQKLIVTLALPLSAQVELKKVVAASERSYRSQQTVPNPIIGCLTS